MPSQAGLSTLAWARVETSFETLYQQHYPRIYGLLYRLLGNQADAEDVSQQLFLKLYQN